MENNDLRQEIINTVRAFNSTGLSAGTSGNLSARIDQRFLITPSGISYDEMTPDDIITMDLDGEIIAGTLNPSGEWRIHKTIYTDRNEINAVVHVHSPDATGIACTRQDIPAFHYMVAVAGGESIRCAKYATFGTEELAKNALDALAARKACLLANHGLIALGENIQTAFKLIKEVESLAEQYWISRQMGGPVILDDTEMRQNLEKFKTYGKQG